MSAARRRLVRIDDVFDITSRGLVVAPSLPPGDAVCAHEADAVLRRGDGTERPCLVRVELTHLRRAHGNAWARVCVLGGVAREEVAPGDEVWCERALVTRLLGDAPAGQP